MLLDACGQFYVESYCTFHIVSCCFIELLTGNSHGTTHHLDSWLATLAPSNGGRDPTARVLPAAVQRPARQSEL